MVFFLCNLNMYVSFLLEEILILTMTHKTQLKNDTAYHPQLHLCNKNKNVVAMTQHITHNCYIATKTTMLKNPHGYVLS